VAFAQLLPRWNTIGNIEYALMPLLGWALVLTGNIVVVRQWKWQAKRAVERAARRRSSRCSCTARAMSCPATSGAFDRATSGFTCSRRCRLAA
jgi:hypothetical protein